jgi:ABC-type protease/lipase transport system fused ATPase/permease subunit
MTKGEAALAETLRRLKAEKRTVVIITHRMSTLAVADSILVMHEGTVKLHGPRDQVLAALRSGNQAGADRQGGAARPAPMAVAASTPATPRFGA